MEGESVTTSGMVLIAACVVVALRDLIVVAKDKNAMPQTISWFVRQQAIAHPTLILAMGIILGHFFAAMKAQ